MHQTGNGRVSVFPERVLQIRIVKHKFRHGRDDLPADRAIRIIWVHQRRKVRRDRHLQLRLEPNRLFLIRGQVNYLLELL